MSRRSALMMILALMTVSSLAYAFIWIYQVDPAICNGCGICIPHCSTGALRMQGPNAVIDPDLCNGCGDCVPWCIRGAIYEYWYNGVEGTGESESVTFGPCPARDILEISGVSPGESIVVMDLTGRRVLETEASGTGNFQLDLSPLPSGSFLLRVGEDFVGPFMLVR